MTVDSAGSAGFPAHLFPASFTLLYCPFEECTQEIPFTDPSSLLSHVEELHNLKVQDSAGVIPFLDRYLAALVSCPTEEDTARRERLQSHRLQEILALQAVERSTQHHKARHCLFCSVHLPTSQLFDHMFQEHGFNIGQLDNLVMVGEFLDTLQAKLDRNKCIYCEKDFPNGTVLRKHIKNKNHYRIHPQNHVYDKYYVVNYLQVGRLYDEDAARGEREEQKSETGEEEWAELVEPVDERTTCLLCPHTTSDAEECIAHLSSAHSFSWDMIRVLDTYEAIKVINYIRVRVAELACIYCDVEFGTEEEMAQHLQTHTHSIPERKLWDDPRFLFPIYDDDPLLCHLDEESS